MTTKPFWTDDQLGAASDAALTAAEVAALTGRSVEAVKQVRRRLAAGWSPTNLPWSIYDDDFIRSSPHLTAAQIARHLAHTTSAVRRRRIEIGEGPGQGYRSNPNEVGRRRLLAKTCTGCGLLLSADWFGFNQSKWRTSCLRCVPRRNYTKPGQRSEGKLQDLSLPHATRSGETYTTADHGVLADPDLTIFEKAVQLGRTYEAIRGMLSRNGYSSKVGKGDPVKGQWRIYRPAEVA